MSNKILLVDDDKRFLKIYSQILREEGYWVITEDSGQKALDTLKNKEGEIDLIISDMVMPNMNGVELIEKIKDVYPTIKIIIMTGQGSIENAVEAMQKGAYTYLLKPVNIEELLLGVKKAFDFIKIYQENTYLKSELALKEDSLIGISKQINDIKKIISIISTTNSSVFITGESGTGKEIVAKLIHQNSLRKDKLMIKVNCGALAEGVLESELFGHEKGAFTGATYRKKGKFEIANEGTLFLDEIGDMPLNTQLKLLRVIQEKEFERVGGIESISTDFRLICATNKDLSTGIAKESFREDLYYRINVIPIYIPPLRERRDDIPLLISYFAKKFAGEMGKEEVRLTHETKKQLINYSWPGNIRELKNIIERLTVFYQGTPISPEALPISVSKEDINIVSQPITIKEAKEEFEMNFILSALKKNQWNVTKTSQEIGIARKNLQIKINKYNLK